MDNLQRNIVLKSNMSKSGCSVQIDIDDNTFSMYTDKNTDVSRGYIRLSDELHDTYGSEYEKDPAKEDIKTVFAAAVMTISALHRMYVLMYCVNRGGRDEMGERV